MRITSKGQVTIPADVREVAGLLPNTEVEFVVDGEGVRLVPSASTEARRKQQSRGGRLVTRLRGSATINMSTDEIMALTRDGLGDGNETA